MRGNRANPPGKGGFREDRYVPAQARTGPVRTAFRSVRTRL
ncbi:Uncharacterized protein dnm_019290 [Desulfonema magnum]|uniref:Uncharacterized protein n=1 Tax=Desulfonema magnum TaxID=45655 RepID=A0A975BI39_9BACT|nr:Uncharacterized protein dnm_019290 [Desulfonema magnum]